MNVLAIHGDEAARQALSVLLRAADFTVTPAARADEGLAWIRAGECDAVVAPLEMPDLDAPGLARAMRLGAGSVVTPLLVLDARDAVAAKVACLQAGADDYLTTPCHRDELAARLRGLVRRAAGMPSEVLTCGPIALDLAARRVTVDGQAVRVTPQELRLLEALMLRQGRALAKETLLALMRRDANDEPEIKIVDVYVCKVRAKLADANAAAAACLTTVWGHGYRMASGSVGGEDGAAAPAPAPDPGTRGALQREVADRLGEALDSVAPRGLSFSTLSSLAGDGVSEGTVRRALDLLSARGRARFERVGHAYHWRAGAAA